MATDQEIRDRGIKFLPLQKYLQNPYEFPVEEETAPVQGGITNTNSFTNSGDNNFNSAGNNFQNNTNVLGLRTPGSDFASSGSYITNRTNSGSMLPGAEKEDNFLQKILKAGGRGIASMIPGAGMFMSVADKFDRFDDLNPLDQEFINSQMSGYEQNIHGTQNLPQQDRYGYNKRSALGNYSELIDKRMGIAKGFIDFNHPDADEDGYYRPIDKYYNDKSKDKNTIKSQMDMNDKVRNHIINQKAQKGPAINNPFSEDYSGNTQSPNYTPTGPNQPDPTPTNNNGGRDPNQGNTQTGHGKSGMGRDPDDKMAKGGRVGYFFGGRARLQGGGGAGMGAEDKAAERASKGYGTTPDTGSKSGTNDYSTTTQTQNNDRSIINNQNRVPKESILNRTMDLGSELSYLNNLKNLNVMGIVGNIGVNKFRNYLDNRKTTEENDKLSYNTNPLPTNNYMAKVSKQDLSRYSQQKDLIDKQDYPSAMDTTFFGSEITPYEFQEMKKGNITEPGTYVGADGGRVYLVNGGLAGLL